MAWKNKVMPTPTPDVSAPPLNRDVIRHSWRPIRRTTPLALVLGGMALSLSPSLSPRFENAQLNDLAGAALCIALPVAMVWFSIYLRMWAFWLVSMAAGVVAIPVALVAILISPSWTAPEPDSDPFLLIRELRIDRASYRLYRTNGGATTDYGLALRKEYRVFPGIKLITKVVGVSPAYDGYLHAVAPAGVRLDVRPYGKNPGRSYTSAR